MTASRSGRWTTRSHASRRNARSTRLAWTRWRCSWPRHPVCGSATVPTSERERRTEPRRARLRRLPRRAVRAEAHDVQAVGGRREPLFGRTTDRHAQQAFGVHVRKEVANQSAGRADEMVMMLGELLRQLVAAEVLRRDHAVDDPRVLEDGQVPVRRAHGEPAPPIEDLVDREWTDGRAEDLEQGTTPRGEPLAHLPEPESHDRVNVGDIAARISHGSPP